MGMQYLDFLCKRHSNMCDAFDEIDGGVGNKSEAARTGVVTLSKFEDSVQAMKCHKFGRPTDAETRQRINAIYRYIDRNGNGQVSVGEFGVLEVLSKEIQLTIREFVDFCTRRFGCKLADAWAFFDKENSGEVA